MKIGIIGGGVVGHATARVFMEHADVLVYDKMRGRSTHDLLDVIECDLVFVCLPSPKSKMGSWCDTTIIEECFGFMSGAYGKSNLVLRSTVPIGFTRRMAETYKLPNLVHNPEFLTARCALVDSQTPARNIIGKPSWQTDATCCATLEAIYRRRFPGVPVLVMSSDESEAVKVGLNSFFAVKVAYFNELRCLCDMHGLDWETVRAGILSDGRIAHAHTQVPGPDGKRGFGGTCLPKDLASMVDQLGEAGMLCNAALRRNEAIDRRFNNAEEPGTRESGQAR